MSKSQWQNFLFSGAKIAQHSLQVLWGVLRLSWMIFADEPSRRPSAVCQRQPSLWSQTSLWYSGNWNNYLNIVSWKRFEALKLKLLQNIYFGLKKTVKLKEFLFFPSVLMIVIEYSKSLSPFVGNIWRSATFFLNSCRREAVGIFLWLNFFFRCSLPKTFVDF